MVPPRPPEIRYCCQSHAMIDWILPGLANPIIFSFVTLVDKQVLSGYNLAFRSFNLFVGCTQGLFSLIIVLVNPLPAGTEITVLLGGLGVGVIHSVSLSLMFWVLSKQDASRVVPVFQSFPIIVAVLAWVFFDEVLGPLQWVAVLLAVGGGILVSVRFGSRARGARFEPVFLLLVLASFLFALSLILLEKTTHDLSVFHTLALRGAGLFTAMTLFYGRPKVVVELARFLKVPRRSLWLVLSEAILPFTAHYLGITAISRGPVSLVSALMGTRPVGVFIFGLIGSRLTPLSIHESYARAEIPLKLASAAMVTAAVILIAVG